MMLLLSCIEVVAIINRVRIHPTLDHSQRREVIAELRSVAADFDKSTPTTTPTPCRFQEEAPRGKE